MPSRHLFISDSVLMAPMSVRRLKATTEIDAPCTAPRRTCARCTAAATTNTRHQQQQQHHMTQCATSSSAVTDKPSDASLYFTRGQQ